jgi:ribosomal protein S27AE
MMVSSVEDESQNKLHRAGNKEMITCPECKVPVRTDHLQRHLEKAHSGDRPKIISSELTGSNGKPLKKMLRNYIHIGVKDHDKSVDNYYHAPTKLPEYVLDESGFLHSYNEWYTNETQASGHHKIVSQPSTSGTSNRSKHLKTKKVNKSQTVIINAVCPKCGVALKATHLERHMKNVHAQDQAKNQDKSVGNEGN